MIALIGGTLPSNAGSIHTQGRCWAHFTFGLLGPKEPIMGGDAVTIMAGATTLGDLAGALGIRAQESAIVAELKAGSEDAYAWLIGEFHQPIYSLVYRIVTDSSDAADTTQEVFLKVFRGMKHFHGESSLKTWIYRIAVHEASNRRRWWFRHKAKESSIEPTPDENGMSTAGTRETLVDEGESPFDSMMHEEIRARVEEELRQVSEPYRTSVILRDLEDMSYEEIAEITQVSLGTVKSRLTRGREALRRRLTTYVMENGQQLGLRVPDESRSDSGTGCPVSAVEVAR
jgi:RNA polymerase sigma-70 factor (ECF subfamily)